MKNRVFLACLALAAGTLLSRAPASSRLLREAAAAPITSTSTSGFTPLAQCVGVPVGTPSVTSAGAANAVWDSAGQSMYVYGSSTWIKVGPGSGGGGGSLQASYALGATIVESGGVPVAFSSTTADGSNVVTIAKSPAGTEAGSTLYVSQNANCTDPAFLLDSANSGSLAIVKFRGYSDALSWFLDYYGTAHSESVFVTGAYQALDGFGQGCSIFSSEAYTMYMSDPYEFVWGLNGVGNDTLHTWLFQPSAGVIAVGKTDRTTADGSIKMGGATGGGTLAPTWTNSPVTLTGSRNPYTWLTFVATDGTTVYVPAFK